MQTLTPVNSAEGQVPASLDSVRIRIEQMEHSRGLPLPVYSTSGSAGMDLHAALIDDLILDPGKRDLVPTGLRIALPAGYEAQIRSRSGLAAKNGVACLNSPGTIDSDYRGEIKVILINHGEEPFAIHRGDRIAQMVIAPVTLAVWDPGFVDDDTDRGSGGFGHSGVATPAPSTSHRIDSQAE